MLMRTWHFEDKSDWGDGPWQHEFDKMQWQDPVTGFPCIIRRSPFMGNWCGYVGIPRTHPRYGEHYDNTGDLEAHGGLTFSERCSPDADEYGICHIVQPGEPDDVWWFGFDCGHYMDFSPGMRARMREIMPPHLQRGLDSFETYKDYNYIVTEVESLAKQLQAEVT